VKAVGHLAKVEVEGSNPFARSKFSQENQSVVRGLPEGGPALLALTFIGLKKCKHYVSS